jgi:hypothetical protein
MPQLPEFWTTVGIFAAVFAALFGGGALYVSVRTLKRIDTQLEVANKELTLVGREVAVVEAEFKMLSLRAKVEVFGKLDYGVTPWAGNNVDTFEVYVSARNSGDRLSRSLIAELLVAEINKPRIMEAPRDRFQFDSGKRELDGEIFFVCTLPFPDLHPNQALMERRFPAIALSSHVEECRLRLRLYDENFAYPETDYEWLTYRRRNEDA